MNELTEQIKKTPKSAGELLTTKEDITQWITYILPKIAVYFHTTIGFPVESFQEEISKLNLVEQLSFCLSQVRKQHYV